VAEADADFLVLLVGLTGFAGQAIDVDDQGGAGAEFADYLEGGGGTLGVEGLEGVGQPVFSAEPFDGGVHFVTLLAEDPAPDHEGAVDALAEEVGGQQPVRTEVKGAVDIGPFLLQETLQRTGSANEVVGGNELLVEGGVHLLQQQLPE